MFKLESYITPLILSYVDKYVKNLKPEDSQFSLWGGDAVFSNLDLRLDVLEKEVLQLPFNFVNGHIHELRIHVPWTKLISEPIVITINTIECVLKLHDGTSDNDDASSASSVKSSKGDFSKKKNKKLDEINVPPGYVRSLINKIVNNIKIVCNNVIFKYVEDDIVMSLNVKSAEMFSVNEKWEPAFIDLSLPELVLRKLIQLTDLTVCLDKRNASGKIEIYQDPLLYRCSLNCRLYTRFNTLHSKQHSVLRLDVFCQHLDFSVTDEQVPMLLRLFKLVLALYYGRINNEQPESAVTAVKDGNYSSQVNDDEAELDSADNESWSSWAWSFVPGIISDEDEEDDEVDINTGRKFPPPVSQYAIHINTASVIFKLTEIIKEAPCLTKSGITNVLKPHSASKVKFEPLMELNFQGMGLLATLQFPDFAEIQFGITKAQISSIGRCVCGMDDCNSANKSAEDFIFFEAGLCPKKSDVNYLKMSLFDPLSDENQGRHRKFQFDWDACIKQQFTPGCDGFALWEKYGAFMIHSLYKLNLPSDWNDKTSEISLNESFLETSNILEKALVRIVVGESCVDIQSSMIHRIQKMLFCAKQCEHEPYGCLAEEKTVDMKTNYSHEEIRSVEESMPTRTFEISVLQPTINIYISNHSMCDFQTTRISSASKLMKTRKNSVKQPVMYLPIVVLKLQEVYFQYSQAMYPCHITKAALSSLHLGTASQTLLNSIYSHSTLKLYNLEMHITSTEDSSKVYIIHGSSGALQRKNMLMPAAWVDFIDLELAETHAEMTQLIIDITKPQLYLLTNIYHSWFINHPDPSRLANTSLLSDVLSVTKGHLTLKFQVTGINLMQSSTKCIQAIRATIDTVTIKIKDSENEIYLLHGPEEISGCHFTNFFSSNKSSVPHTVNQPSRSLPGMASSTNVKKFITFLLQLPIAPEDQSPVLYMSLLEIQAFTSILDPVLLKWLNYQPKLTAKGYSHIAMVSDAEQFLNYDSKFSSTASSAPTKSASQSISHATPCPLASADQTKSEKIEIVEETQEFEWSSYFSKYSLVLNKILIQVQMNASYILVPNHSLGSLAVQNNLSSAVKQAIISTRFSHADMLVINLPVINVFSNTIQRHNQAGELPSFPASIPVEKYIDGCLNVEQFPWTVKVSNFCVYTVHKNNLTHEAKYVINPLGFSSTVAVTTKFSNHSLSNKLTAYCIHADMEALHLNFCIKQVELISELGSFVTKFIPLLTKPPDLISTLSQSPVPSLLPKSSMTPIVPPLVNPLSSSSVYEISYVNSVTVKSTNEEENKTHKDELDQIFQEGSAENSVSLWLQWTIPKLCWNIFSSDGLSDEWLMFELEDLTTSFDIQEVYFKAKSKIGAFNITSLHKRSLETQWKANKDGGIILSCSDKLPQQIMVLDSKTGQDQIMPHAAIYECPPPTGGEAPNHGFFSFTFIQASSQSFHSRLRKQEKLSSTSEKLNEGECCPYIMEVDINMQPADIVIQPMTGISAALVFQPLVELIVDHLPYSSVPNEDFYPVGWGFNNKNVPLLHINSSTIRIFFLNQNLSDLPRSADMLMLQLDSIVITPRAENPISRNILLPKVYNKFKKLHHIPGSSVEDRQYQIDVSGISLSTGCWAEFLECGNIKKPDSSAIPVSMGENPALEWNTKGLVALQNNPDVIVCPLLSRFDVKVILVPAIVYTPEDSEQDQLVSGISVEINASSEMIFTVSIEQLELINMIYTSNVNQIHAGLAACNSYMKDSGIESEVSTTKDSPVKENLNILEANSPDCASFSSARRTSFIPFDVLLTANSISILTYFEEETLPDWANISKKYDVKEIKKHKQRCSYKPSLKCNSSSNTHFVKDRGSLKDTFIDDVTFNVSDSNDSLSSLPKYNSNNSAVSEDSEGLGYEGSDDSMSENEDNMPVYKKRLYPFMIINVLHPHSLIKCHPLMQHFEISCFDLNVRSAQGLLPISGRKMIPGSSDYKVNWIETAAGEPDAKTGVAACLFILSASDFLHQPGTVDIKIDRPVNLNVSLLKLEQLQTFLSKIQSVCTDNKYIEKKASGIVSEKYTKKSNTSEDFSIKLKRVTATTEQMVIVVETVPHIKNAHVVMSFTDLSSDLYMDFEDDLRALSTSIALDNFLLTTAIDNNKSQMIGPCTDLHVKISLDWSVMQNNAPIITTVLKGGTIPIKVAQENIKCIQIMAEKIQSNDFLIGLLKNQSEDEIKVEKYLQNSDAMKQTFNDDLRKGKFLYIQNLGIDHINGSPGPHEIVFNTEASDRHPASMCWTYPQPRYLTKVEIYPLPFYSSNNENSQICCCLQYWDSLRERFLNFKKFIIQEATHCSVELYGEGNAEFSHKTPFSTTWRVQLDVSDVNIDRSTIPNLPQLSPLSLAACMQVDSCYDPHHIPHLQFSICTELIYCTLYNSYNIKDIPNELQPFEFDDSMPKCQEIGVISVNGFSLLFQNRSTSKYLQFAADFSIKIMDYLNLSMINLLDSCTAEGSYFKKKELNQPTVQECEVLMHPMFIHIGRAALHCISLCLKVWPETLKKHEAITVIPTYYVICNNTCEFIKFGQVNTDEAIRLESLKMQCYSWRSLRSKLLLNIFVKGSEWSEGFSLCHQCKIVQTLKFGKTNEVYLIVDIKKLSETLTQIIINGQIIVSSRFSQHLELLMSKHSDPEMNKKRSKPVSHIIGQKKAIPSFVIHPSDIKHFRVRLMGQSNPWSSEIILKTCHALIQLPLKDSQKFISVWLTVFKENINNIPQYLILFTPLYILRSHLPQSLKLFINTPSINESCEIDVCSQGHEHDIVIESINSEISHQLNFQIGDGNKLSSPSVPLSPGMVDQITTPNDSIQDIDNMLKDCISTHPLKWPYCQIKDLDSALMNLTERNIEKLLSAKDINKYNSAPVHPNIELQVQLSQRWTCCKTLLIDVKPLMLFVNKSGLDLVLLLCEDDGSQNSWLIPAGTVFTPPKLKGSFRVGIQKEKKLFLSDPLQMSCEETSNLKTYWPNKIKGLIPTSGYTNISIDVTNQNKLNYLCQLSIRTVIKEGIQILSIHQLYSFCNKSDCDLQVATACYPAVSSKKYSWDSSTKCALLGTKTSIVGSSQDIVYWFSGSEIVNSQTEFISFLSARHIDPSSGESSNWSVPISLPSFKGSNSDTKASLVIPMLCKVKPLALTNSLKSYVLTSHVKDGICFMIVQNDKYPSMIISNFCNFNLHFGQNSSGDSFGTTVIEEKDALDCVPFIPPNMSYPYTLPQACTEFPNISNQNTQAVRKLNLCLRSVSETSHCINSWSSSVTTNDVNDQFVTITGGCDTRIIKQVIGNTLYMHIYPIHRAQILAKDVRSKITASASCTSSILATRYSTQASPPLPDEKDVPIQVSNTSLIEESPEHKPEKSKVKKMLHRRTPSKQIQLITDNDRHLNFVSILFKHVCVILVDEKLFQHTEAIRVSLDDMCFILRPLNTTIDHFSLTNSISQKYKLFLSSRGLQVDNQLLDQGFDFPVVLKAQDEIKDKDFTLDNMLQLASKSSLINIELQLVICDETISFQTVQFASKPLSIYFEDKFLYKILDIIKILSPKIMQSQSISQVNTFCDPATCIIPMDLLLESSVISCPIRIQELVIKPLKVMFSVHASVKLYLSIDHTPLSFKVYERKDLFTSSYALGRDFTMHYMSGALFRAGWAVASMDLLGNPAGFVRSVGTGISHFVQLPYRGLILGPWSFVIGMSHGSASLIRHIASGTLMSVTNLASSVSRNMDRLSLDSDHVSHQEQLRQQHPVGLTDGLALGLNGLGYSLLGAVAGLVDKPMQNVINNESTIHAVSGVVSGLSQGMLGIVTKPIGGAAELVAQAGQGLLHGAGWSKVLKRRYKPFTTDLVTISSNSSLKYSWKMMGLLTSQDVIYSIDSTHINHVGMYVSCSIILTSQALFIVNERDDTKHQAYALTEIVCLSSSTDPTLFFLKPRNLKPHLTQGNSHVPDRIAEFVTKQDLTTDQPDMDEDDNNTSSTENKTKFCVHPKHRHTFLTLFTIAQKQLFSKGFPVL